MAISYEKVAKRPYIFRQLTDLLIAEWEKVKKQKKRDGITLKR